MAGPTINADPVVDQIAPGGVVTETAVTFRGWLSSLTADTGGAPRGDAPAADKVYRFFTSPWFDEWLEIKKSDLLFQLPGSATGDGSSIIWVRREAKIAKCEAADACHFADEEIELGTDPTAANPTAARYPRHG